MGAGIHYTAERRGPSGSWENISDTLDGDRNYALFGWLAGVRNYSGLPTFHPGRGMPRDATAQSLDFHEGNHSHTWYLLDELCSFDFDAPVEDRRITVQTSPNSWNGGATAQPGGGKMTTYRALFYGFPDQIAKVKASGAERLIISFDS